MYSVRFTKDCLKQLKKLDKATSALILAWIKKNLENCTDPRVHGKPPVADKAGQWRYRIGDYRLLCNIQDSALVILALNVGHRRDIYK